MKTELEEVAKNYYENNKFKSDYPHCPYSFKDGAKWQQKQMYSDEIIDILDNVRYWDTCPNDYISIIEQFLEQFKKK